MDLKSKIRNINDFPEKGVIFRDITTLIKDAEAFAYVTETMAEQVSGQDIDCLLYTSIWEKKRPLKLL